MAGKSLLEVKNLHVNIEDKEILHGVNLTIGEDETHVLMGPNGTGKSTLGYGQSKIFNIRRTDNIQWRGHYQYACQ